MSQVRINPEGLAALWAEQVDYHTHESERNDVSPEYAKQQQNLATGIWTAAAIFDSIITGEVTTHMRKEVDRLRLARLDDEVERDVFTCAVCGRAVDAETFVRWLNDGKTGVCLTCADKHERTGLWLSEDGEVFTRDGLLESAIDAHMANRLPFDGSPAGQAQPDPYAHPAITQCTGCGKDIPSRFEYCEQCVTGQPETHTYAECESCGDSYRDDFLYTSVHGQRVCTVCISGVGFTPTPAGIGAPANVHDDAEPTVEPEPVFTLTLTGSYLPHWV